MGFGVKFYTALSDGRLLVTTSFESVAVPSPRAQVVKHSERASIGDAWLRHQQRVEALTMDASILEANDFTAFVAMAREEEGSILGGHSVPRGNAGTKQTDRS